VAASRIAAGARQQRDDFVLERNRRRMQQALDFNRDADLFVAVSNDQFGSSFAPRLDRAVLADGRDLRVADFELGRAGQIDGSTAGRCSRHKQLLGCLGAIQEDAVGGDLQIRGQRRSLADQGADKQERFGDAAHHLPIPRMPPGTHQ
jgi:hypothetical protein